ncbi:hypothetical protein TNCV_3557131 [Trichonephila clavipes]|uniref:Uncharacterized protein n=1 Tax=Trichonephila clavipes TaxID=2585209 RepID=A0A8X7BI77_TRICX|nr:hypothetical protein TNCV_3557131 [Trichonephila clavipes]
MNRYTNAELADIHFIQHLANGNKCDAVRLLWSKIPVPVCGCFPLQPVHTSPPRLNSDKYFVFQQDKLPELLTDVPVPVRHRMWFQQDEAPSHYGRCVRDH